MADLASPDVFTRGLIEEGKKLSDFSAAVRRGDDPHVDVDRRRERLR